MPKTSTIQVRIDSKIKEEADELFEILGTSTSEAIRLFISQCLIHQRIPMRIDRPIKVNAGQISGILAEYSVATQRGREREAWIRSLAKAPEHLLGGTPDVSTPNAEGDRAYRI